MRNIVASSGSRFGIARVLAGSRFQVLTKITRQEADKLPAAREVHNVHMATISRLGP